MLGDSKGHSSRMFGFPLKHVALTALTFHTTFQIVVMHYSRTMPLVNGQRYFPSTAVFLNELVKLPICVSMALYEIASNPHTPDTSTAAGLFGELSRAVFTGDSWKLAVPAMLYTLQNNLQYVAIGNLDAVTFQVTSQMKILSTALFSILLLKRGLDARRWCSLFLLMLGVAIIFTPGGSASSMLGLKDLRKRGTEFLDLRNGHAKRHINTDMLAKRSATYAGIDEDWAAMNPEMDTSIGLITLALACMLSGFTGVFFEKVLKEPKNEYGNSVWVRNTQLSFYSLWPALFVGVVFNDGEHIAKAGFFAGYNWAVWLAIFSQAIGGILVAFVVKYANNITKNFATSISIILSFVASVIIFDFDITIFYLLGTSIVLFATYLYNTPTLDHERAEPPQLNLPTPDEKTDEPSYFDIDAAASPGKTTSRAEGLSTSRPNTPSLERIPRRMKSSELRTLRRDQ